MSTVTYTLTVERLRQLANKVNRDRRFDSAEAKAFMLLYHDEIEVALGEAINDLLRAKVGASQ